MQPISATDAIGLAFTHTREVLAPRPFRLGRFLKLALVAALTQATYFSICVAYPLQALQFALLSHYRPTGRSAHPGAFPGPGASASHAPFAGHTAFFATPASAMGSGALAALGIGVLLLIFALTLVLTLIWLYLICRVRVTLLELVLSRAAQVRLAWRLHKRAAWRYFGLFVLAMLLFWCVMAAVLVPLFIHVFHSIRSAQGSAAIEGIDPTNMSTLIFTSIGLIWLFMPFWLAIDALLQDFILPGLALDPASPVREAFARLASLLRRRPGQLLLFLILRTVLALGIALALGMVALVVIGLLALIAFLVGKLFYGILWSGGLLAHSFFFAIIAALVLVIAALYLLAMTAIYGITGTFKTSYAAWFYAGDYPPLAARLLPQPPEDEALVGTGLPSPHPTFPPLPAQAAPPPELW